MGTVAAKPPSARTTVGGADALAPSVRTGRVIVRTVRIAASGRVIGRTAPIARATVRTEATAGPTVLAAHAPRTAEAIAAARVIAGTSVRGRGAIAGMTVPGRSVALVTGAPATGVTVRGTAMSVGGTIAMNVAEATVPTATRRVTVGAEAPALSAVVSGDPGTTADGPAADTTPAAGPAAGTTTAAGPAAGTTTVAARGPARRRERIAPSSPGSPKASPGASSTRRCARNCAA
ncbi:hypothetical protein GCM10009626_24210 [Brachybacterium sacelli]